MPDTFDLDPWATVGTLSFNAGRSLISDASVRNEYTRSIRSMSDRMRSSLNSSNHSLVANEAVRARNFYMDISRGKSSQVAKSIASSLKERGKTLHQLESDYAKKLFNLEVKDLDHAKRSKVWTAIINSSGRSNQHVNTILQFGGYAGKTLAITSLAALFYSLYEEEDKAEVLKLSAGAFIGGTAMMAKSSGAIMGGSVICGPLYYGCVGVGFILAGAVGVAGGQFVVETIF